MFLRIGGDVRYPSSYERRTYSLTCGTLGWLPRLFRLQ